MKAGRRASLPVVAPGGQEGKKLPKAAAVCSLLVSLAGGALLTWWAVEFHRSNQHLWMVPVGLVALGTPAVAWFSVAASDAWRAVEGRLLASDDEPAATDHFPKERRDAVHA